MDKNLDIVNNEGLTEAMAGATGNSMLGMVGGLAVGMVAGVVLDRFVINPIVKKIKAAKAKKAEEKPEEKKSES